MLTPKELRMKMGLTQSAFADRFHLNVRTVQTWEQGLSEPVRGMLWMMNRLAELEGWT